MTSSWLLPRVVELAATYLVQSTLFLVGGWALLPVLAARSRWANPNPNGQIRPPCQSSPALTERIWKLSVLLALVTVPLSVFTGWSHPAWEWSWREQSSPTVAVAVSETAEHEAGATLEPPVVVPVHTALPTRPIPMDEDTTQPAQIADEPSTAFVAIPAMSHVQDHNFDQRADGNQVGMEPVAILPMDVESPAESNRELASVPLQTATKPPYSEIGWLGLLLVVWFGLSAARLVMKNRSLHRCLAACKPIEGDLRRELNRLVPSGCTVRLLSAPVPQVDAAITEPFACGLLRWTIVLPAGIDRELSTAELKALLAHEVAHLVRRDSWWLLLAEVLCTCLAFQPLNFLARSRWQQAAELLCDDWAVERHVSATSLASCLTRIAERRLNRRVAAFGLAAVGRLGLLTQRIEWLLRSGRAAESRRHRGRIVATLLTFAAGLLVGMYGPRLSFVDSVEAGDDVEAIAVWDEIHRDLDETLNELSRIDLQLASDPEAAALATRLRVRAALLKLRLNQ